MKLTEQQLMQLIRESAMKVINEIGYHEKQKREVSDKEHAEWVKKKSEAKKRELERQRKEKGDEKSDSKSIDYYDYKHGKGNFPVMNEESKVRLSTSEFQKFITESVKRTINRMLTEHETWEPYGSPENEPIEDFLDNPPSDIPMNETTLDYDMDNFSGRWSRGSRYDILVDGDVYYSDVPEESVDRLYADLERRGYENIRVQEL
jgi:hypothetical protein